jgi:hypothetical protein
MSNGPSDASFYWSKNLTKVPFQSTTGLINCAVGGIAGGLFGLVAFRSGGGWRGACAAAGVGVGLGSTLERASFMPKFK